MELIQTLVSELDDTLNDLDKIITSILQCLEQGRSITIKKSVRKMGFDIAANIQINSLESLAKSQTQRQESLIDVLEYDDEIKVIAMIPGIRKENLTVSVGDGFIEIAVMGTKDPFAKKIPCNIRPSQITTKSFSYNNSVVEIVFKKGRMT